MSRARNGGSDGVNVAYRVLLAGLFVLVTSVPLAALLVEGVGGVTSRRWLFLPLPPLQQSVDLVPTIAGGEFDLTGWLWGVLADLLELVLAVVYYLVLSSVLVGATLTVGAGVWIGDPREIGRIAGRALGHPVVRGLLGTYAVLGLGALFPATARLVVEVVLTGALWLLVLAVVLVLWRRVESTPHLSRRIALWYPLTIALLGLPTVVVGIVSPSVRPWFLTVTDAVAGPLFESGNVAGSTVGSGIGAGPRALAYGGFWVAATLVTGWVVGTLTEAVTRLHTSVASRVGAAWERSVRALRDRFDGR